MTLTSLSPDSELMRQHVAHVERQRRLYQPVNNGETPKAANDTVKKPKRHDMVFPVLSGSVSASLGYPHEWFYSQTEFARHSKARQFVDAVAYEHGSTFAELTGHARTKNIVAARAKAYKLLKSQLGWSLPRIGKFMGGKDHTTVLHALRRLESGAYDG